VGSLPSGCAHAPRRRHRELLGELFGVEQPVGHVSRRAAYSAAIRAISGQLCSRAQVSGDSHAAQKRPLLSAWGAVGAVGVVGAFWLGDLGLTRPCLRCGTLTRRGSYCRRCDWKARRKINTGWDWGKRRAAVRERDLCVRCGSADDLEVHHRIPLTERGTNAADNLELRCHRCHSAAHTSGRSLGRAGRRQEPVDGGGEQHRDA
jgi:5-methylcytosine-specific restriction endonuclease McrA